VVGPCAPAPPLTASLTAVAAGTLPSDGGLGSTAAPVRCAPPTAPAASPRLSPLRASTRTAAGGGPATAGARPCGPDHVPRLPLPRRRAVPRGRLSRGFAPALAFAIADTRGAPWLPSRASHVDAAGCPGGDGLLVCASCPAGYAAAPPRVTPGPRAPATRLSGDDRDRTCTGQLSGPCRAHQPRVRRPLPVTVLWRRCPSPSLC